MIEKEAKTCANIQFEISLKECSVKVRWANNILTHTHTVTQSDTHTHTLLGDLFSLVTLFKACTPLHFTVAYIDSPHIHSKYGFPPSSFSPEQVVLVSFFPDNRQTTQSEKKL